MRIKNHEVDMISINHQIKENDLFRNSNISEQDFGDLKLGIINLKTGEILFRQGDSAESIYLIIEGEISLIKEQGFGKTHSCLSENKFFGHEEYFLQTDRNSVAIALNDSCLVELTKENIEILLSRDNSILNNVKNPSLKPNSPSTSKFENILKELPGLIDKPSAVFPMELKTTYDEQSSQDSNNDMPAISDSKITVYNKIDLNKIKFEINTIINKFNENLLRLEEEKDKLQSLRTAYEDDNTRLLEEIEKLREQEAGFISLDKEKTEILGRQSYRIIELEEETAKFPEIETGYSKKIELLNEQVSKDEISIKKLDAELKDKGTIVSKLENDLEENKIALSNLNETVLILTGKTDDQERVIKGQKIELENSEKRIDEISLELSSKEVSLIELNKNLLNKNAIISTLNDNANKVKADLERAQKALGTKDEVIQNQSAKIGELQSKLDYQKESEKNKNEYILNQAHKIAEIEDLLKNNLNELAQKDEIINNFIQENKAQSEKVLQKQSLINDQNRVIAELNDEVSSLKKLSADFNSKEKDLKNTITDLSFHLSKANSKLISLSDEVNEKNRLAEAKEEENSILQKNFEELNSTLKKKIEQIIDLDDTITHLKNELSESNKLREEFNSHKTELVTSTEAYNKLKNENSSLSEQIKTLNLQIEESKNSSSNLESLNAELNKFKSESDSKTDENDDLKNENSFLFEQIKTLKLQIEEGKNENSNLISMDAELNLLKSKYDSQTNEYTELKNENSFLTEQIKTLKHQIEESKNESNNLISMNAEFNKLKAEFDSITKSYNELKIENSFLSEKVDAFRLRIKESKNESNSLTILKTELNKLRSEEEKYKHDILQRDRIVEEQKEHIENIRLANSKELKTINSAKSSYESELRIKDDKIAELTNKLGHIQRTLDEKAFFENQQFETIDNQAQKIAELELLINESKANSNNPTIVKEGNVLKTESPKTNYAEPVKLNPDEEIFSKCKLIKTRPVDASFTDGTFEHYQDIDIQIVNVNLTRATIDVVSIFNEFLREISSKEKNKIIVNLLTCEFIDSSILGALVSNLKKVTALGGDLRLVGFHPAVKSMMELTRMHRLFEYFPTVESAIRSFD